MKEFNVVTIGDYVPQAADVEGRALVGGTMTVNSTISFNSIDRSDPVALYANAINIASGKRLQVLNGGVVTPSTPNASDFSFTNVSTLTSGTSGQAKIGDLYQKLGIPASRLGQTLITASTEWKDVPANAMITNPGQNVRFTAGSGIAVFNVSPSDIFAQNYNPQFVTQADTTAILINVSGKNTNNKSFGQNSFRNGEGIN